MNYYVVIVAGGQGQRMQSNIPKQFLTLSGKPILMHTIEAFHSFSRRIEIILVLPTEFKAKWEFLLNEYRYAIKHQIVNGGENRFESVKNGLDQVPANGLVAIHDGVRPLVSKTTIEKVFDTAQKLGNAIPVVPVAESVRQIDATHNFPVDRSRFCLVQTPQCFKANQIKTAYEKDYRKEFTDDATVLEAMGIKINLVEGNIENIKITKPSDIQFAEALMA